MSAAKRERSGSSDGLHCSGVTDTPANGFDVQGMPDILAELRARAMTEVQNAKNECDDLYNRKLYWLSADRYKHELAFTKVVQWLDELGACQTNNTAPDTKSGSAGIP